MLGKRLVQKCDVLNILEAVEQGSVPWHEHNRVALTLKVYEHFDSHTVEVRMRLSMLRQVKQAVEKAQRQGYVQLQLDAVHLSVKGREYLAKLDQPQRHELAVLVESRLVGVGGFVVECTCGWTSREGTETMARYVHEQHAEKAKAAPGDKPAKAAC